MTDNSLQVYGKQLKLVHPTSSAIEIANASYNLFESLYKWNNPVRAAGVAISDFTLGTEQMFFDENKDKIDKQDRLDVAVDSIRRKYGNSSMQRARVLQDKKLAETDIKGDPFGKNL